MHLISWKEKAFELRKLIKQVSDQNGGDDPFWLEEYISEVIKTHKNDLEPVLECFRSLLKII